MKLIIAEKSIAARRIANILGTPSVSKEGSVPIFKLPNAIVVPLRGHIVNVDFPKKYKHWTGTALPLLVESELVYKTEIQAIARALKKYAKQADTCIIATDYDREGESIGKEALDIVKSTNNNIKIERAKFSALTKGEVENAFKQLSDFDYDLANSADARREIDLIWGAVLTRFVSIAAKRLGKAFLSVGRVQTPTLALTVDREKEIRAFNPEDFWVTEIECEKEKDKFTAVYKDEKLFNKEKAMQLSKLKGDTAKVVKVLKKEIHASPPTPFNTTSFLRASASVGIQPGQAMKLAETLYTNGYISYPRTDNTHFPESLDLRDILEKLSHSKELGNLAKKLLNKKKLTPTKGKKKTTDHPPIHPVSLVKKSKLKPKEWKIYELIVRRFFSTMAEPAVIDTVKAGLNYSDEKFIARGKVIRKQGWKEFYIYSKTKEEFLPELEKGDIVKVSDLRTTKKQTKPRPRYTPSALIKELDQLNLGTKATRAEIIQKLIYRGYISGKKNFTPSEIAFAMIDTLEEYADEITKPDMTSNLEKEMDKIEEGKLEKENVVHESRKMLSDILRKMALNNNKISKKLQSAIGSDDTLSECPSCGKKLRIIRTKRGTRFVGCSGYITGCDVSFPLPSRGKIIKQNKLCEECGLPVIKIINGRRYYTMCINHKCKTKEAWKKNKK